jgi:carbon monoxide dehydrogenase subunit G
MTRKLEELFELPPAEDTPKADAGALPAEDLRSQLQTLDLNIDKIDQALPGVRGLEANDEEMDGLAKMATSSYDELMTLGMQVDSRFASEIFSVASNMLGHAITAKTAKMDKK